LGKKESRWRAHGENRLLTPKRRICREKTAFSAATVRLAQKPAGWRRNRRAGAETGGLAQKPAGWRRNRRAGAETGGLARKPTSG
jgi:hypothetical protein